MNEKLLVSVGFGKEVGLVKKNICPICQELVNIDNFRDSLSLKEYRVSGLCQSCQDDIFGK